MGKLKKQSKRQPARMRYKIQKKIRDHNRKTRREAKKNPKSKKQASVIKVPNICPFKEDILKEVEAMKKQKEEERQKQREQAKLDRQNLKQTEKQEESSKGLAELVAKAEMRGIIHENTTIAETDKTLKGNQEHSLKTYHKVFIKVIELADVVFEVLDARDPLGTRCVLVEQTIRAMKGNKRLVVVLNKADLVPRDVLDQWLKYFRKTTAAVIFKASTQDQSNKLGQKKLAKAPKAMQSSTSVGADTLIQLLANYCRNKGIKTSIRVGVVGLPNVGKSSIINSLKRSRACNVGATPGVTRGMQEVHLDSKIILLDSPGIVFASGSDSSSSLRNCMNIATLEDPITPANAILQRVTKQQMMEMYDVSTYSTPDEFYSLKASRMGRFKKGGIPDTKAAARSILGDWNSGKIRYYTVPPEDDLTETHISASIVTEIAKEFDLNSFDAMEVELLDKIAAGPENNAFQIETLGLTEGIEPMEEDSPKDNLLSNKISIDTENKKVPKQKRKEKKEVDKEMELEGNQKLNQLKKKQFKKEKKMRNRREKVSIQLSSGLENFSLKSGDKDSDDDTNMN